MLLAALNMLLELLPVFNYFNYCFITLNYLRLRFFLPPERRLLSS
jgi:hypothetical protein